MRQSQAANIATHKPIQQSKAEREFSPPQLEDIHYAYFRQGKGRPGEHKKGLFEALETNEDKGHE